MRLKTEEIKQLATHCGNQVLADPKNVFKVARTKIFEAIQSVLSQHFDQERQIEEEAKQLFEQNNAQEMTGEQKAKSLLKIQKMIAQEKDFYLSGGPYGRMSPDKISHMAHLVADKLYDDDLMDFPDEDDGPKFFKQVITKYFAREDQIDEIVRKKIMSLKSAPLEYSKEWEILYRKYSEEEKRRMGHDG